MKRSPLSRTNKGLSRGKSRMQGVSPQKREKLQEYSRRSKEFLKENPWCQVCADEGKDVPSTNLHHVRGRAGDALLDEESWLPCCSACHPHRIHFGNRENEGPKWARSKNYLA